MRILLRALLIVPVLAVIFVCLLMWELGLTGNWGFESGYYGQFNQVTHILEAMPNVQITEYWHHQDTSIEDFGFTLLVDDTLSVAVDFWDSSPQKQLRDNAAIQSYLETQIEDARVAGSTP